jgi:hypothetical protein
MRRLLDEALYEKERLEQEIIRLQDKRDAEGLSEWEYQTLKMRQKQLRDLRRRIWNSGH